jgi:hypothetical protein
MKNKQLATIDNDEMLFKDIAMDIGKEVVAYIEVMYPQAISATSSTFKLSVRNCIYNEIIAAMKITNQDAIKSRLEERSRFRRKWKAQYRDIRETDWEHYRQKADREYSQALK